MFFLWMFLLNWIILMVIFWSSHTGAHLLEIPIIKRQLLWDYNNKFPFKML